MKKAADLCSSMEWGGRGACGSRGASESGAAHAGALDRAASHVTDQVREARSSMEGGRGACGFVGLRRSEAVLGSLDLRLQAP